VTKRKFKAIKQPAESEICLGAVMAMATHTTIQDVEKIIGKKQNYSDKDFITYLLHWGFYIGSGYTVKSPVRKNAKLTTSFSLKNNPAYIVVRSQREEDSFHAIYWDGTQIYDPNPYNKNGLALSSYDVVEIYPIKEFLLTEPAERQIYEGIQP